MNRFFQAAKSFAKKVAPITASFGAGVGYTACTIGKAIEIKCKLLDIDEKSFVISPKRFTEEDVNAIMKAGVEGMVVGGALGASVAVFPAALAGGFAATVALMK